MNENGSHKLPRKNFSNQLNWLPLWKEDDGIAHTGVILSHRKKPSRDNFSFLLTDTLSHKREREGKRKLCSGNKVCITKKCARH